MTDTRRDVAEREALRKRLYWMREFPSGTTTVCKVCGWEVFMHGHADDCPVSEIEEIILRSPEPSEGREPDAVIPEREDAPLHIANCRTVARLCGRCGTDMELQHVCEQCGQRVASDSPEREDGTSDLRGAVGAGPQRRPGRHHLVDQGAHGRRRVSAVRGGSRRGAAEGAGQPGPRPGFHMKHRVDDRFHLPLRAIRVHIRCCGGGKWRAAGLINRRERVRYPSPLLLHPGPAMTR